MIKRLMTNPYIVALFENGSQIILGLLNSVLINRFLGPSLKGEYAYLMNIVNILVILFNLGIYQSYPFFKRKGIERIRDKYLSIFSLQFITYSAAAILLSAIVRDLQLTLILMLIPVMILTHQLTFIALVENTNLRNVLNMISSVLYTTALIITYFTTSKSYISILLLLYLEQIVRVILIIAAFRMKSIFNLRNIDWQLLVGMIRFGVYPMFTALMMTLNYEADILILKFFTDYEHIGYYTIGAGLASKAWVIPDAFKNVLSGKTAKNDSIENILLSLKVTLYANLLIMTGIILIGNRIITTLYGLEYSSAYRVTMVIFAGIIPMGFYKIINTLFQAKGQQKRSFYILLAAVIVNLSANFILIPFMGNIGAALSSVLSYSLCGGCFLYLFMRDYHLGWGDVFLFNREEMEGFKSLIFGSRRRAKEKRDAKSLTREMIKSLLRKLKTREYIYQVRGRGDIKYFFMLCDVKIDNGETVSHTVDQLKQEIDKQSKEIEKFKELWAKRQMIDNEIVNLREKISNNNSKLAEAQKYFMQVLQRRSALRALIQEKKKTIKDISRSYDVKLIQAYGNSIRKLEAEMDYLDMKYDEVRKAMVQIYKDRMELENKMDKQIAGLIEINTRMERKDMG
jgi:O-antigen/teichoic acid export membrane protein